MIDGGLKLGWKLLLHTKDSIVIQEGYPFLPENTAQSTDGYHKFEILEELPFTSARQRMTIIVRDTWSNRICLYSKGADSRILSLSCDEDILSEYFLFYVFIILIVIIYLQVTVLQSLLLQVVLI